MCKAERQLKVRTFFMMDENFLLYKRRALELLAEMKKHGKGWSLYVFSSARRCARTTCGSWSSSGIVGVDGIRVGAERLPQAQEHRHDRPHARAAGARHTRAGLDDHRQARYALRRRPATGSLRASAGLSGPHTRL